MSDQSVTTQNAALNAMLNSASVYWLSIHSADPGTTGANEVTTGTGNNGRQQITFAAANAGSVLSSGSHASQTFTGASLAGNGWPGIWTAQTSGTYLWGSPTAAITGPVSSSASISFAASAIVATES